MQCQHVEEMAQMRQKFDELQAMIMKGGQVCMPTSGSGASSYSHNRSPHDVQPTVNYMGGQPTPPCFNVTQV